jgi:hypothetical protein
MKAILVKPFSPALADGPPDYPYFILHKLAERGVGCVEAEKPADGGEVVSWTFTSRLTGEKLELARSPRGMFRPVLARFALVADINPYGGHAYFAAEPAPHWPAAGLHRFSLYLSNHPSTGAWIRLYLCAIDGVWPPGNVEPPPTAT